MNAPATLSTPPASAPAPDQFVMAKPYAYTMVDAPYGDGCVRIFRDSPESVCFQVRTLGSIHTPNGCKGKQRPAFSTVSLSYSELTRVIAELTGLRDTIRPAHRR